MIEWTAIPGAMGNGATAVMNGLPGVMPYTLLPIRVLLGSNLSASALLLRTSPIARTTVSGSLTSLLISCTTENPAT